MKKILLASVFVLGATLAVSAQTTKSCDTEHGTKSCCKSSNSVSTGTTTTTTNTKSACCTRGTTTTSTTTTTNTEPKNSPSASASAVLNSNKGVTEGTINTEEPKK